MTPPSRTWPTTTPSSDVPADPDPALPWIAVVPVKRLEQAKSRLAPGTGTRRSALARAFAVDTITALRRVHAVRLVVVVSGDRQARDALQTTGVEVLDEPNPPGLNAAVCAGIEWARAGHPDAAVAVFSADLPALRTQDAAALLLMASQHPRCALADQEGTGTTVLTARPGQLLLPRFGPDSLARHLADGAVRLTGVRLLRAARDVDTTRHLAEAVRLGVGPATARVLAG